MNKKLLLLLFFLTSCSFSNSNVSTIKDKITANTQQTAKVYIDETYAYKGNKSAKNVMVEYFDFKCGACAKSKSNIEKMLSIYPDKIKVVYKHYPFISDVSYELAYLFERISLENKDKSWELYNYIFDHSSEINTINDVQELGKKYSTKVFTKEEEDKIKDRIKKDKAEAELFEISGTPLFLLNNQVLMRGATQESDFLSVMEEAIGK